MFTDNVHANKEMFSVVLLYRVLYAYKFDLILNQDIYI